MLAPSLQNVKEDLSDTMNSFLSIFGFCQSLLSASVGRLEPPQTWLADVDAVMADSRLVARSWLDDRPHIIAPLTTLFIDYAATFKAAAETMTKAVDNAAWIEFLTSLCDTARANSAATTQVRNLIGRHQADFAALHVRLRDALTLAQQQHEAEQGDMLQVAVKLQQLVDRLDTLGVGTTAADIASGKQMVTTTATVIYEVMVLESTMPYMSVIVMAYSMGSTLYDVIVSDAEISKLLAEVAKLTQAMAADVRSLAVTSALIAVFERLNEAYIGASQRVPRLNAYWDAEADKITAARDALNNGVDAGRVLDLQGLGNAAMVWAQLSSAASVLAKPATGDGKTAELRMTVHPTT